VVIGKMTDFMAQSIRRHHLMSKVGWLFLKIGQTDTAVELFQTATDTLKADTGQEVPHTIHLVQTGLIAALRQAGRDDEASHLTRESLAEVARNLRCGRYTASQCCTAEGASWLLWMHRLLKPLETIRRGDWLMLRASVLAANNEADAAVLAALRAAVDAGYSLPKMDASSAAKKQAANKLVYTWPSFAGMAARLTIPVSVSDSHPGVFPEAHIEANSNLNRENSAQFVRLETDLERNNGRRPRRKICSRVTGIFVVTGWLCLLTFVMVHTIGQQCYSSTECETGRYCDRSPQCQSFGIWDCDQKCHRCSYLESMPCNEVQGDCCSATFVANNCPNDPANCSAM
jgi:hypothetical protein